MRWPAVGPRSATSGCVRARTRAHATRIRNDNVGLRTFIIGLDGRIHTLYGIVECMPVYLYRIFVSLLLIVFLVINAVYCHADCHVNPFIE